MELTITLTKRKELKQMKRERLTEQELREAIRKVRQHLKTNNLTREDYAKSIGVTNDALYKFLYNKVQTRLGVDKYLRGIPSVKNEDTPLQKSNIPPSTNNSTPHAKYDIVPLTDPCDIPTLLKAGKTLNDVERGLNYMMFDGFPCSFKNGHMVNFNCIVPTDSMITTLVKKTITPKVGKVYQWTDGDKYVCTHITDDNQWVLRCLGKDMTVIVTLEQFNEQYEVI